MAQFSLSVINNRGSTILTDYDSVQGKTAGLTFDERLNLTTDGSTLDFAMLKYLYEGSQKVVNTPAISLTYGSIIKCIVNGNRYDFAIVEINYQFLSENLQLQFSAQDYFQFENSQIGVGYTISADTTDPEYFGAQPIDTWVRKIIHDNNIRWGYIPINQANREWINIMLTQQHRQYLFDTSIDDKGYWNLKDADATLNTWVSFECSNSSAYNALKQLASENDLTIVVDYANHNFWFAPTKNVIFNGYYFNPNNNLQSFSIRGNAQNLVTVLNITGPKDLDNQEITLVPTIPLELLSVIDSDEWLDTKYYPSLYTKYTDDAQFIREIAYTPWFENKLIDISYFTDNNLILASEKQELMNILYNQLRIINGRLIVYQRQYLKQYEEDYMRHNQAVIDCENVNATLYGDMDALYSLIQQERPVCFATKDVDGSPWLYMLDRFTYYAQVNGAEYLINAANLSEGSALHTYLSSPELSEHDVTIQCPMKSYGDLTQSFRIESLSDSSVSYVLPFFIANGNCIKYYGESVGAGWLLSYQSQLGNYDMTQKLRVPQYCKKLIFSVSMTGPSNNITLHHDGDTWYGRGDRDDDFIELSTNSSSLTTLECAYSNIKIYRQTAHDAEIVDFYLAFNSQPLNARSITILEFNSDQPCIWDNENTESPVRVNLAFSLDNNKKLQATITNAHSSNINIVANNKMIYDSTTTSINEVQLPNASDGGDIYVNYIYRASSGAIGHIEVLKGPINIYGKYIPNPSVTIQTNVLKFDEDLNGSYIFNSLANALAYTGTTATIFPSLQTSNAQPTWLNQLAGIRDNYAQTLSENCGKLLELWNTNTPVTTGGLIRNVSWGNFITQYYTIGILSNGNDIMEAGQPYNNIDGEVLTSADIAILTKFLNTDNKSDFVLLRSNVVSFISVMVTNVTEKWQLCYNAAMGLGAYWPKDWNICDWLCKSRPVNFLQYEQELLLNLLPLLPTNWKDISRNTLYLNPSYMPFNKNLNTWTWQGQYNQ